MQNKCKTMFESVEYTSNYDILINAKSVFKNWMYLKNANKKSRLLCVDFHCMSLPLIAVQQSTNFKKIFFLIFCRPQHKTQIFLILWLNVIKSTLCEIKNTA